MAQSYNGWPASQDPDAIGIVRSDLFPGGVKGGDVHTVLRYVAEQLNARVEGIVGGWCWGYSYRANVNNPSSLSCHSSGTAIDWNAPEHPNGVTGTWSDAQRGEIYRILDECQGSVHWLDGVDGGTADEMHFEICVDAATLARVARELPGGAVPEPEPEPPSPGEITMYVVIDGVACIAMVGQVAFYFKDWNTYLESLQMSPNVPALVVGGSEDYEDRLWLNGAIINQSIMAQGIDPRPDA